VKALAVVIGSVLALIGFTVTLGGAAWSASDNPSAPVITFDDAGHQAQLTIPTPACPASQPGCEWKFFLNEPKLSVDVATVYGTSGTLTIPYPKDFCGVIQADAYVGPPWVAKRGWQHTISDCTPTPPTTVLPGPPVTAPPVTAPPATTPITPPASTPLPSKLPVVAATSATIPDGSPTTTVAPSVVPATATPAATPAAAQLPYTGLSVRPLLITGLTLVLLGFCLLIRRRPGLHSKGRTRVG
jgi:hypothetical protein